MVNKKSIQVQPETHELLKKIIGAKDSNGRRRWRSMDDWIFARANEEGG